MPIVAFIGGRNAPPGKSLGHAGAIISGNFGTPQSKIAAFQAAASRSPIVRRRFRACLPSEWPPSSSGRSRPS